MSVFIPTAPNTRISTYVGTQSFIYAHAGTRTDNTPTPTPPHPLLRIHPKYAYALSFNSTTPARSHAHPAGLHPTPHKDTQAPNTHTSATGTRWSSRVPRTISRLISGSVESTGLSMPRHDSSRGALCLSRVSCAAPSRGTCRRPACESVWHDTS